MSRRRHRGNAPAIDNSVTGSNRTLDASECTYGNATKPATDAIDHDARAAEAAWRIAAAK